MVISTETHSRMVSSERDFEEPSSGIYEEEKVERLYKSEVVDDS